MNGILTGQSGDIKTAQTSSSRKDSETTGSLAMIDNTPLFSVPVYNYDMFVPTNPFSLNIDFSSYSREGRENLANNSTFMQGFVNAMAALSAGGAFGGFSGVGSAGISTASSVGGSCSMGGGFTSVG